MKRRYSLKKNKDFNFTYHRGTSTASRSVVVIFLKRKELKIGLSVSKKIGNAVVRNRYKRYFREAIRPYLDKLRCGQYIFIARQGIIGSDFAAVETNVKYVLNKGKLIDTK